MTCHLPSRLQEQAAAAEKRKDDVLDRMLGRVGAAPKEDAFERALRVLIDADKAALNAKTRNRE